LFAEHERLWGFAPLWCIIDAMKRLAFLFLLVAMFSSCEQEIKKPTEDTLLSKEAISMAEGLRDAYVRKAFTEMRKYCTGKGYESIRAGILDFDSVELDFTPKWVEIEEDGSVFLNVSWEGKWALGDFEKDSKGMAVFRLKGRPLRVEEIVRGSPFVQPRAPALR
jgi:hypothetical protein